MDEAAVNQLIQQHKVFQASQVKEQLGFYPFHRKKRHVFQNGNFLRRKMAQIENLPHNLQHMGHHQLRTALGRPGGTAQIIQHGCGGEVRGLHLLGQQLDAVGVKTNALKHLPQRRFLLRRQGPFVEFFEQGQLVFPAVQGLYGQLLIPFLFPADAGGDDHGIPPL